MIARHKQGFLRLMAEKLYRHRQSTHTDTGTGTGLPGDLTVSIATPDGCWTCLRDLGYRIEDIRYLGLSDQEWLWIQERVLEMALAETHTTTTQ